MRVFMNGQSVGSIVDMQDEEQNRALKRAIGGAFTTKSLLDYEPDVDTTLEELLQRIGHSSNFILHEILQWFQLDFLMKIAFTETPGHLQHGTDVYGLSTLTARRIAHWNSLQSLPQLERFIYRNPIWGRFLAQPSEWAKMSRKRFTNRLAVTKEGQGLERRDLLQKCIDYSEKYPNVLKPQTITSVVNSIISAGTDTTSGAMTAILDSSAESSSWHSMERIVPSSGCFVNGIFIPGGTVIGCLAMVVHMDQACFGKDSDVFRPERWLNRSDAERIAMERGFLGWSAGSRVCLGRHIAELEIKKVIPTLLLKYNITLDNPNIKLPFVNGVLEYGTNPISVTFSARENGECD
ncbi:cytochrome P450 [Trichoderma velutinum]